MLEEIVLFQKSVLVGWSYYLRDVVVLLRQRSDQISFSYQLGFNLLFFDLVLDHSTFSLLSSLDNVRSVLKQRSCGGLGPGHEGPSVGFFRSE